MERRVMRKLCNFLQPNPPMDELKSYYRKLANEQQVADCAAAVHAVSS